jgi:hypothetical protein
MGANERLETAASYENTLPRLQHAALGTRLGFPAGDNADQVSGVELG